MATEHLTLEAALRYWRDQQAAGSTTSGGNSGAIGMSNQYYGGGGMWGGDAVPKHYYRTIVQPSTGVDWNEEKMKEWLDQYETKPIKDATIDVEKLLYSVKIKNQKKLEAIKDKLAKLVQVVEIDGEPFYFVPVESLSDILNIITEVMQDETI